MEQEDAVSLAQITAAGQRIFQETTDGLAGLAEECGHARRLADWFTDLSVFTPARITAPIISPSQPRILGFL